MSTLRRLRELHFARGWTIGGRAQMGHAHRRRRAFVRQQKRSLSSLQARSRHSDDDIVRILAASPDSSFECPESNCVQVFKSKSGLRRHVASIHKDVKYECPECDRSFASSWGMRVHRQSDHEGRTYRCTEAGCSHEVKTKSALKSHIASKHHDVTHQCPTVGCSRVFKSSSRLAWHIANVHRGANHFCKDESCSQVFSTRSKMLRHFQTAHKFDALKWVCEPCGAKFLYKSDLERHVRQSPDEHSRIDRSAVPVSTSELHSPGLFVEHRLIADQSLHHNTTAEARRRIDSERRVGVTQLKDMSISDHMLAIEQAPGFAFFGVSPSSAAGEGVFPISSFPRSVLPGARTEMLKVQLGFVARGLASGRLRMFHAQTLPSQGRLWNRRKYVACVVVADERHWGACEEFYVEMDASRNFLMNLGEGDQWSLATLVKEPSGEQRSLQVFVAFCGGLDISECEHSWHSAWRLKPVPGSHPQFQNFECPVCQDTTVSLALLRRHYFSHHTPDFSRPRRATVGLPASR